MSSVAMDFFGRMSQLMSDREYHNIKHYPSDDEVKLIQQGDDSVGFKFHDRRLYDVGAKWAKQPLAEKALRRAKREQEAYRKLSKKNHTLNPIIEKQNQEKVKQLESGLQKAKELAAEHEAELTKAIDRFAMDEFLRDLRSGNLILNNMPQNINMAKFIAGDVAEEIKVRRFLTQEADNYAKQAGEARSPLLAYWLSFYGVTADFMHEMYMELSSFSQDFIPEEPGHVNNFEALATHNKASDYQRYKSFAKVVDKQFQDSQKQFDYSVILNFEARSSSDVAPKDSIKHGIDNFAPHFREMLHYMKLFQALQVGLEGQKKGLSCMPVTDADDRREKINVMVLESLFQQGYIKLAQEKVASDEEVDAQTISDAESMAAFQTPVASSPDSSRALRRHSAPKPLKLEVLPGAEKFQASPMTTSFNKRRRKSMTPRLKIKAGSLERQASNGEVHEESNDLKLVEAYLQHKLKSYKPQSNDYQVLTDKLAVIQQYSSAVALGHQDLASAVHHLLTESYDVLNQKRNKWDCFHKKARTLKILEAIRDHDHDALNSLLPKGVKNDLHVTGIIAHV